VHIRTTLIITAAITGAFALAACGPTSTTGSSTATGAGATTATASSAPTSAEAPPAAKAETIAVPNLVGKGLQTAQDTSQAAGLYVLTSHDSLGQDRMQVLDRNWKVCFQKPAPGSKVAATTTIDLGAVKLTEDCPKTDQKPPAQAGTTMPNYVGKGLKAARNSLPGDASVTVKDATGDRMILMESNWKVCSQDPKAGAAYSGQPVTLTAVKTDETCP
jgi:beta-lactam-binding protein with PASTA domain